MCVVEDRASRLTRWMARNKIVLVTTSATKLIAYGTILIRLWILLVCPTRGVGAEKEGSDCDLCTDSEWRRRSSPFRSIEFAGYEFSRPIPTSPPPYFHIACQLPSFGWLYWRGQPTTTQRKRNRSTSKHVFTMCFISSLNVNSLSTLWPTKTTTENGKTLFYLNNPPVYCSNIIEMKITMGIENGNRSPCGGSRRHKIQD